MEPTWSIWHLRTKRQSCVIKALQERQQTTPHLLLHQVFKLCDLLSVFRVARDVLLIKESLQTKEKKQSQIYGAVLWHYIIPKHQTL